MNGEATEFIGLGNSYNLEVMSGDGRLYNDDQVVVSICVRGTDEHVDLSEKEVERLIAHLQSISKVRHIFINYDEDTVCNPGEGTSWVLRLEKGDGPMCSKCKSELKGTWGL